MLEFMETSSRIVAKEFGRSHRDVLNAIKKLKCSDNFYTDNFKLSEFQDNKGRCFPEYVIQQAGYLMLVFNFTNVKATKFKEDFILDYKNTMILWPEIENRFY